MNEMLAPVHDKSNQRQNIGSFLFIPPYEALFLQKNYNII